MSRGPYRWTNVPYVAGGHHFITKNGGRAFSPDSLYLLPNHVKCGATPLNPESQ